MNIVLVNPQIPQNTGAIARTCAATNTKLRLVGNISFDISEKAVRRAGLDYWPYVDIKTHDTWESYLEENKDSRIWLISKFGTREYWDADFCESDSIVFGSESTEESVQGLAVNLKYVTGDSQKIDSVKSPYTVKYSFLSPIENLDSHNVDIVDYTSLGISVNPSV